MVHIVYITILNVMNCLYGFLLLPFFFISSCNIHAVSSPQCVHNNFKCNVLLVWFLAKILEYAVKSRNPTNNMINGENLDSKILDVV
jgi:hypothetical protein